MHILTMYMLQSFTALLLIIGASSDIAIDSNIPGSHFIDLSYDLAADTNVWPTFDKFKITERTVKNTTDWMYVAQSFCMPEHGGTHLDAPSHVHENRWSVDQIPIHHFISPGVKIDISDKVTAGDVDAEMDTDDLLKWEEQHGRIPNGAVILVYSGWGKYWSNSTAYFGTDISTITKETKYHYPGINPDAAKWLVDNRNIVGMGVDTPSTDNGPSQDFRTHRILAQYNIYGLENTMISEELPAFGSTIYVFPLKIRGGSGSPCRIIASFQQMQLTSSVMKRSPLGVLLLITVTLTFAKIF